MEGVLPGPTQRQLERNKELPRQQEKTQATIKKDARRLQLLWSEVQGRSRRPLRKKDGLTVQSYDADADTCESDDSEERLEAGRFGKSIQTLQPALEEPPSRGAGDYKGRLRPITKKKWNLDVLCTLEEQDSSDDAFEDFEDSEKSVVKALRDFKTCSDWGAKKRRTDRGSACETRQVSSRPKSTQETENINLRDHGSAKAPSNEGFLEWIRSKRKRANDRRPSAGWGSAGWGSAPVKHEISSKEKHPGRPLHDGNVVAGLRTIRSGSPLSSVERIGSSCKRNQPPRRCNMVAEIESCPRELGGLHEGPATPMTPPIRKRKAGNLSDGFPEAHGLDALSNRRARSDGTEKAMQEQYYQLSSNGEEATEHSRRAVGGWCDQTPPPSSILPFENFGADQFDAFINGEFNKDPGFDNLDAFANGQLYRPTASVNGSQFYWGRESIPTLPLNDLGACIKCPETTYFKGGEGVFPVQDRIAFSAASESGTNDSLGTAQSDEDYHPPPRYVTLQSMTDNVGAPIQTSYPSRSRRSLSFSNDGVTRRVGSTSPLSSSDVQPPAATPNKVTQTLPNTADVMHVNSILDNQQASLSTPIAPSFNGACMGIVDVEEDSEAEDGNLQDEDYEEEGEGLFDLNEPPVQQQQKNLKARKKHRPKVFREGRPSRRRKPKNPEEEIAKKKASEAKKVGEKSGGRKKRATTDLKSSQGDRFEKQGSHSTPGAPNCISGIAAYGQCPENQRVSDAQRGTPSQAVLQTPFPEIVSVRRPNNPLTGEIARPQAPDSSPLFTSPSPSPNLSRKRVDEEDRLIVTDSPLSQRGPRRELFKRARSKQTRAVFEQGLRLGDKPQESLLLESQEPSMGEALVDPRASVAEVAGPVMVRGWNSSNPEEGVLGRSLLIPTEVGSNTSFSKRMRAAARAKGSRSNLSNRVTKPRSIRIPSIARRVKKQMEKQMDSIAPWGQVVNRLANMELNENNLQLVPHVNQQTAMVPYVGPFMPLRRKKPRPKVMLDEEDKRLWRLVMTQGTSFTDDNSEKEAPRQWDEERAIMKARAEKFINLMHLVQGDRRFSVWKGSVVDSVVGAFLTQNVSDHLSSSAFMCLAARFPVARKKKPAAETSQEPTVTEVQMEESFEVSQKRSELSEAVQEGSVAAFHVEEVVEISEKSSAIGGGSDICCVAAFHVEEALEVSEKSSGTGEGSGICCNEQAQDHTGTVSYTCAEERLTDVREQNSSCSSKDSQSKCHSSVCKAAFHAGENLEVRESEEQKTFALVEHFTSLQSGVEDVVLASSGRSHMNSISSRALVDISEREGTQMALASHDRWIDSELSGGSLIVDLGLPKHDLEHMDEVRKSIFKDFHSPSNCLRTHETRGNAAAEEKICSSTLPGVQGICASAEEVAASSGSVVSSSDSVDAHNLCQASVVPGSEINCANGEEIEANAAGVIFPSDSFDSGNSYDKQLVVSAADTDNQLQRRLSLLTESSNLHTLKSLIRTSPKKAGPKARDVNRKKSSELVTSTENDQEQEVRGRGRGKRPVIGLSGLDRARLEESNITSKVAFDWEAVRLKYTEPEMGESPHESAHAGCKSFGSSNVENGVDWDAVRAAKLEEIADVIKERGMNNVLAGRIKAFLERVQKEHGSVDLEWLRTVPVEESKSFLLSIRGLGLKSVECIRLLCLHHLAFPVDTNVGRICVRLGWVPLEPLPEELQLHLLELYPVQETIQKYLWPRLCSLDQRTLYELHYQMITFGKVFCTKSRPNCNACPMRDDCRHFASALSSAKLALPAAAPEDSQSTSSEPLALPAAAAEFMEKVKLALPAGEEGAGLANLNSFIASQKPCEPIVEEPSTPEPVVANSTDIEDMEQLFRREEEPETVFGVSSTSQTLDKGSGTFAEIILPPAEVSIPDPVSKALVCLPPGSESLPVPKLKNAGRLRTVHYVYELPDNHPLVQGMDPREADDPCVYLLAIWSPGESPEAPPVLDDMHTNGTCDGFNGSEEETVKGTVLVPCRTAMRGIFPLNGTYFQVNEVFADHASSIQPIEVPRTLLWNLRRRFVYFGTSVTTIFKNLSVEEIQACFWRGYVCVRGFDSVSRCPRPLAARLHFPASKMIKKTKEGKPIEEEA